MIDNRPNSNVSRLSRRRVLGVGAAGLLTCLAGCGGGGDRLPTASPILPVGTPAVRVPPYDDPTRWKGRTVRVGAWGGEVQAALRSMVWQPFAAATGSTVQEVTTDYSQLRASLNAGQPYADLLLVDGIWAASALAGGYLEPIGSGDIDRARFAPIPANDVALPAYAYAMVSGFRRDAVLRIGEPTTWTEWWDANRYSGMRTLPKEALASFEFALLADGVAPDRLYPLDGARAVESLKRISGKIVDLWWDSGRQPVAWLGRKRADFAAAWHYRVIAGQQDGQAIDFRWNQGLLIADSWVVPKGAPGKDVALDLIRYATAPEVQAALARRIPLGPVNPAAFGLLDKKVAATLPTAPDNVGKLIQVNVDWWAANQVEANERFNSWLLGVPMHG